MTFPLADKCIPFPGRKLLTSIYIASSTIQLPNGKIAIENNYLTMNHTFKITKKIGYTDESSGKFISQYTALFLVMDGAGVIVDYKFTNTVKMSNVANLLKKLKEHFSSPLTMIIVDNCCTVRKKLIDIFGRQLSVKLDLFHAVKRFSTVIPKSLPLRSNMIKEYGLIFRKVNDMKGDRNSPTPTPAILRRNLQDILRITDL